MAKSRCESGHYCAAILCQEPISKAAVMCLYHWAMVPPKLGEEVLKHWHAGDTKGLPYLNAKIEAVEIVHRIERPDLYAAVTP